MSLPGPPDRAEHLRNEIRRHDWLYYVLSKPEISDQQYDTLMKELLSLEKKFPKLRTPDSPTQRVGGTTTSDFAPVAHKTPMLSLDNIYSLQELDDWLERNSKFLAAQKPAFTMEAKIDGVSASLTYQRGRLLRAATRGDAETGEDITSNIKTIRNIPLLLRGANPPPLLEIRGEVVMFKNDFNRMNKKQQRSGSAAFANPRNAASGSLRQKNPKITASRPLKFFLHSFGWANGYEYTSHFRFLEDMAGLGIPVVPFKIYLESADELKNALRQGEKELSRLAFQTDGLVIKIDDSRLQKILAATSKSPRWAVAYKFASHRMTTRINGVIYSVGRTGIITPVADLRPAPCGGVTIRHASLHNFDEIERLKVKIGDIVLVERAGEVIPKVIEVISPGARRESIETPKRCPHCKSEVVKIKEDEVAYRCSNTKSCPAQIRGMILHWSSRQAMEIDGLGEAAVDQLLEKGLVVDVADLYELKKEDLLHLDLFKDRKAENLLGQIQKSKTKPLSRVLFALGIRHVGEKMARDLAQRFNEIKNLAKATEEDLTRVPEVGPIVAQSLREYFQDPGAASLINRLERLGVNLREPKSEQREGPLSGRVVVFTGTLESFARSEAEALVRSLGGETASVITKKVNLVVAGENAGGKLNKAKKLNINVSSEKDFLRLANNLGQLNP